MRRQLALGAPRLLVAGALGVTSALAVTATSAGAQGTTTTTSDGAISAHVAQRSLRLGQRVVVTGSVTDAQSGEAVDLQFERGGTSAWQTIASAPTGAGGTYRLEAAAERSGAVRVVSSAATARAASSSTPPAQAASAEQPIAVHALFAGLRLRTDVLSGGTATVDGVLRPGERGHLVILERRVSGRWRTLATARTDARGAYGLRYRTRGTGSWGLRLRFAGDVAQASALRALPALDVYRRAVASWYGPGLYGHRLACGGRLQPGTLGVAHKHLPCGTRLTLRWGSRSVAVRVIDRGPYVGGREFDLTAATRRALRFPNGGRVWTTR